MCPAQPDEGSQTALWALGGKKTRQQLLKWREVESVNQLWYYTAETSPFFSVDDMNMTAMSKRLTPARLLRTCSVTVGSSFLDKSRGLHKMLHVYISRNQISLKLIHFIKYLLHIKITQSPQDLIEDVRFKWVMENRYISVRLDLLQQKRRTQPGWEVWL